MDNIITYDTSSQTADNTAITISNVTGITLSDLINRIEILENMILDLKDPHPIHIKNVQQKIDKLKDMVINKNKLNDDTQFIHPTIILIEQIEYDIKNTNKITKQQIDELNKIYDNI